MLLRNKGNLYIIIILALVIVGASSIMGGFPGFNPTQTFPTDGSTYIPVGVKNPQSTGQHNLQLKELLFATITPTPTPLPPPPPPVVLTPPVTTTTITNTSLPTQPPSQPTSSNNYCTIDSPKLSTCQCNPEESINLICPMQYGANASCYNNGGQWVGGPVKGTTGNVNCVFPPSSSGYQANIGNASCSVNCWGKPVIYLYPTHTMRVHVALTIPGILTTSIPTYPVGGWNVVAHPGGKLTYEGGTYRELYYESAVSVRTTPDSGLVIPTGDLKQKLLLYTHQLGLLPNEQEEFLQYWMPKLLALHSPYIQFSVLNHQEKERVDHVDVSPRPDTSIEFLVYFKPLETDVAPIKPLLLPQVPPKRVGFTEVEWGGTIDTHRDRS